MKSAIVLLIGVALIAVAAPQQNNSDERIVPRSQQRGAAQKPEVAPAPPRAPVDQQEAEAMRKDLARMRVLLNQMRTNLAFVQSSDTPLKHEFDLNNEMWQMLVEDMERRLQKIGSPPQP